MNNHSRHVSEKSYQHLTTPPGDFPFADSVLPAATPGGIEAWNPGFSGLRAGGACPAGRFAGLVPLAGFEADFGAEAGVPPFASGGGIGAAGGTCFEGDGERAATSALNVLSSFSK